MAEVDHELCFALEDIDNGEYTYLCAKGIKAIVFSNSLHGPYLRLRNTHALCFWCKVPEILSLTNLINIKINKFRFGRQTAMVS